MGIKYTSDFRFEETKIRVKEMERVAAADKTTRQKVDEIRRLKRKRSRPYGTSV